MPNRLEFIVTISARRSQRAVRTNVLAVTGPFSIGTRGATIPAGGAGAVGLVPSRGLIVHGSNKGSDLGALSFVYSRPTLQVQVRANSDFGGEPFLLGQLNERSKKGVLFTSDGEKGQARAVASLVFVDVNGLPTRGRGQGRHGGAAQRPTGCR